MRLLRVVCAQPYNWVRLLRRSSRVSAPCQPALKARHNREGFKYAVNCLVRVGHGGAAHQHAQDLERQQRGARPHDQGLPPRRPLRAQRRYEPAAISVRLCLVLWVVAFLLRTAMAALLNSHLGPRTIATSALQAGPGAHGERAVVRSGKQLWHGADDAGRVRGNAGARKLHGRTRTAAARRTAVYGGPSRLDGGTGAWHLRSNRWPACTLAQAGHECSGHSLIVGSCQSSFP